MYLKKAISMLPGVVVAGLASIASAQTTTTSTPGIPSTGVGGDSTLLFVLAVAAFAVVAGGAYLMWPRNV